MPADNIVALARQTAAYFDIRDSDQYIRIVKIALWAYLKNLEPKGDDNGSVVAPNEVLPKQPYTCGVPSRQIESMCPAVTDHEHKNRSALFTDGERKGLGGLRVAWGSEFD